MSSEIELQEPYRSLWRKGYLRVRADGRKIVDLYNSNEDRTSTAYSRYLISVKIGEILSEEFEVDHKDSDKTNDCISNLQIMTKESHREKTRKEMSGRNCVTLVCHFCKTDFEREVRNIRDQENHFCSRKCNGSFNRIYGTWSGAKKIEVSGEVILRIRSMRESGNSDYKIADTLGLDRSKVWRLRRENGIP